MQKGILKRGNDKSVYEPVVRKPASEKQGPQVPSKSFLGQFFSFLHPKFESTSRLSVRTESDLGSICRHGKGDLTCCRYELKYRISEGKAQAIKDYIRHYLSVDKYALMYPDRQYPISSLYLDSPHLDLCRETLSGKPNRFKLRIRSYSDLPPSPLFVEVKRRLNKVILKSRARIERSELESVLEGVFEGRNHSEKEREALRQFIFYQQSLQARPTVLVRYLREPFEGDGDNRVRVTFDRELCFRKPNGAEVTLNGQGWKPAALGFVVLEIKFTDHYPSWLEEMVRLFNLDLSSMSKYVSSVTCSCRELFGDRTECWRP